MIRAAPGHGEPAAGREAESTVIRIGEQKRAYRGRTHVGDRMARTEKHDVMSESNQEHIT